MKTDVNGRSTCPVGKESFEFFFTQFGRSVQYDFRDAAGELFSCVALDLATARNRRDAWIFARSRN